MDYYTRKQRERKAAEKRAERRETIKTIATALVILPVLWAITVMFLCI